VYIVHKQVVDKVATNIEDHSRTPVWSGTKDWCTGKYLLRKFISISVVSLSSPWSILHLSMLIKWKRPKMN